MFGRRIHRLTTALCVVLSLLFAQLALASYVCPGESDLAAMAQMMEMGGPCEEMDQAQPALCHEYRAGNAQSFEPFKVPTPSLPMVIQVLPLPLFEDAAEAAAAPWSDALQDRPPPTPLFLTTLRLRV